MVSRREFLKLAGLTSAALLMPRERKKKTMIKFDNSALSDYRTAGSLLGWDHLILTRSQPGLVVGIALLDSTTVNYVAGQVENPSLVKDFVFVRGDTNGTIRTEIWCLPTAFDLFNEEFVVGIEVGLNAAVDCAACSVSYANFGGIATHGGATGTGDPASKSLTPIADNSILFSCLSTLTASGVSDAGGQTQRGKLDGANGTMVVSDKGNISPPAATTMQYNNIGVSDIWALSVVELLDIQVSPLPIGIV